MTPEYCDRCPSRALYVVEMPENMGGGLLTFCGHHTDAHRKNLESIGASITTLEREPVTVGT